MTDRLLTRRTATIGVTAALLTLPMAAPAAGLGDGLEDAVDEASDTVERTLDETERALNDADGDDGEASSSGGTTSGVVDTATDTTDSASDGIREVVEKTTEGDVAGAVESTTQTVENTVSGTTDAVGDVVSGPSEGSGPEPSGGDELVEVPAEPERSGPTRAGTAPRLEPDQAFADRSVSTSQGFTRPGSPESPSAFDAPATGGAFDSDPAAEEDRLRTAQDPDVASLSSVPSPGNADSPSSAGVPGTLLAAATALLVLVGAGHALHGLRRLYLG